MASYVLVARSNLPLRNRNLSSSSVSRSVPGVAAPGLITLSQPSIGVRMVSMVFAGCSIGPALTATTSPTVRTLVMPRLTEVVKATVLKISLRLITRVVPTTELVRVG
ncbi:hypothetical protein D3C81_1561920 [compost metagenome]